MAFSVEGQYFEACSCEVSCPCIWLRPATEDSCDVFFAWHITSGQKDGVDLAGLNTALAVHTPKQMTDGNWKVALYLDDRAEPGQAEALGAIFSGQAGGHLANVVPLIGEVAGVKSVPISFDASNGSRSVQVGDALTMRVEEIAGLDGVNPPVITNSLLGAITQPLRQAKSVELKYLDAWEFETSERNAFTTSEFAYEG
jgi:hypothetical protein